ncbi:hypothetical protein Taro_025296 [Colocasia esculenta]|uniref:Uncharacterized protein n=1 Tax=Colocasia esculenta TaxID=4460 RepID=A0A843VMY3_COLES|nr:hypothetical protein [Colocasia esculenta]
MTPHGRRALCMRSYVVYKSHSPPFAHTFLHPLYLPCSCLSYFLLLEVLLEELLEFLASKLLQLFRYSYFYLEVNLLLKLLPLLATGGGCYILGEPTTSAPADQFQEGLVESTSDEDVEPTVGSGGRGKGIAPEILLLTRKAHHRSRKKKIHVHMEPVIARLNAHGEILSSLQLDVTSIFISQSTGAKEIGAVKSELQEMRCELGSLKKLVTDLSDFVRVHLLAPASAAPTQSVPEEVGPSGPSVAESGPPGPSLEELGPSGPCAVEDISAGPSGPSVQLEELFVSDQALLCVHLGLGLETFEILLRFCVVPLSVRRVD